MYYVLPRNAPQRGVLFKLTLKKTENMNKLYTTTTLLLFAILSFTATAQNTCTSVANGNATSPATWSCVPAGFIPLPGDDVIINHDVILDNDWAYSSGSVLINSSGTLTGDSPARGVWIDGGTFTNDGLFEVANLGTNSGVIVNNGTMDIDLRYYNAAPNMTNNGSIINADSLWNNGTLTSPGSIDCEQLWNSGTMYAYATTDAINILNTGAMENTANMNCNYFGSSGVFTNSGNIEVANDMANWEMFTNTSAGYINVGGDFWNADSATNLAYFTHDGFIRVSNDWYNSDTIIGSGTICVANSSYNGDYLGGTIDFCDQTGGSVDFNTGTIAAGVTFCTTTCNVGINDLDNKLELILSPNPATNATYLITELPVQSIEVADASGRLVRAEIRNEQERIAIYKGSLEPGIYYISIRFTTGQLGVSRVVFR